MINVQIIENPRNMRRPSDAIAATPQDWPGTPWDSRVDWGKALFYIASAGDSPQGQSLNTAIGLAVIDDVLPGTTEVPARIVGITGPEAQQKGLLALMAATLAGQREIVVVESGVLKSNVANTALRIGFDTTNGESVEPGEPSPELHIGRKTVAENAARLRGFIALANLVAPSQIPNRAVAIATHPSGVLTREPLPSAA